MQLVAAFRDHRAVDDVDQLADVARIVVILEQTHHRLGNAADRLVVLLAEFLQKMETEERDVIPALPQGGQVDRIHVQAIKQVFAEIAFFDLFEKVLVDGGDDAHVDLQVFG